MTEQAVTNTCPECGAGLPPGATVCQFCGTRVSPPVAPPTVVYEGPAPLNGLAVASLVLSLLWIVGFASAAAILCGYFAKKQIAQTGDRGGGLATAGLVIGAFGLGMAILIVTLGTIFGGETTKADNARARSDIIAVAAAETNYFNVHHTYATSTGQLGVGTVLEREEAIDIATGRGGFCVVGSDGTDNPWFLYDSSDGGATLNTHSYSTGFLAEDGCQARNVGSFVPLMPS